MKSNFWIAVWIILIAVNCFNLGFQCGNHVSLKEVCKGIHGKSPDKAKIVKGKLKCLYLKEKK
jgi:hypothetical protein